MQWAVAGSVFAQNWSVHWEGKSGDVMQISVHFLSSLQWYRSQVWESCLSRCTQVHFISLCSGCDLLLLAAWVAAEHSSSHSQQQACFGERWNLNVLLCHTLLFRKKVAPPPDPRLQPESCLLLPPTPTRGGQKARVSSRTNTYILVDSGLRVRISSDTKLCSQNLC